METRVGSPELAVDSGDGLDDGPRHGNLMAPSISDLGKIRAKLIRLTVLPCTV